MSEFEVEPGAARDSVLITSGSFDNFEQMTSSLEEIKNGNAEAHEESNSNGATQEEQEVSANKEENGMDRVEDVETSLDWTSKKKHIFVLSTAGKPIFSR